VCDGFEGMAKERVKHNFMYLIWPRRMKHFSIKNVFLIYEFV
jgi:hypothetical protein